MFIRRTEKEENGRKIIGRNNGWTLSELDENSSNSRISVNPKHKKDEKIPQWDTS